MKRCNNCGWGQNPDSCTHCEKCNSPLADKGGINQTLRDGGGYQASPEVNLNQTVREPGWRCQPQKPAPAYESTME